MPTAKLRRPNSITVHTVAVICAAPPTMPYPQKAQDSTGSSTCPKPTSVSRMVAAIGAEYTNRANVAPAAESFTCARCFCSIKRTV